jgi:hypothetical protein
VILPNFEVQLKEWESDCEKEIFSTPRRLIKIDPSPIIQSRFLANTIVLSCFNTKDVHALICGEV